MNESTGRFSKKSAIKIRLNELAIARSVRIEMSQINYYASCLSNFPFEVIDQTISKFEHEVPDDFKPRWPDIQALMSRCRQIAAGEAEPKFYCLDCANEDGWLYFDVKTGHRLRAAAIVDAGERGRRRERCPCGGNQTNWRALEQDRAAHPENYFTINEVIRDFNEKRRAEGKGGFDL